MKFKIGSDKKTKKSYSITGMKFYATMFGQRVNFLDCLKINIVLMSIVNA